MTSGYMMSTLEPEHRLMPQESTTLTRNTSLTQPSPEATEKPDSESSPLSSDSSSDHGKRKRKYSRNQEVLEKLVDRKSEMKDDEQEEAAEKQDQDQLKKPRRKDTPVLKSPPHIPGVRLLREAERQMIHLDEDEEKDVKD